jgi:hypothetical protein
MAGNLAILKQKCEQGFFVDPVWKQRNLDWQGVAKLIEDETNRTGDYKHAKNEADGFCWTSSSKIPIGGNSLPINCDLMTSSIYQWNR